MRKLTIALALLLTQHTAVLASDWVEDPASSTPAASTDKAPAANTQPTALAETAPVATDPDNFSASPKRSWVDSINTHSLGSAAKATTRGLLAPVRGLGHATASMLDAAAQQQSANAEYMQWLKWNRPDIYWSVQESQANRRAWQWQQFQNNMRPVPFYSPSHSYMVTPFGNSYMVQQNY